MQLKADYEDMWVMKFFLTTPTSGMKVLSWKGRQGVKPMIWHLAFVGVQLSWLLNHRSLTPRHEDVKLMRQGVLFNRHH